MVSKDGYHKRSLNQPGGLTPLQILLKALVLTSVDPFSSELTLDFFCSPSYSCSEEISSPASSESEHGDDPELWSQTALDSYTSSATNPYSIRTGVFLSRKNGDVRPSLPGYHGD